MGQNPASRGVIILDNIYSFSTAIFDAVEISIGATTTDLERLNLTQAQFDALGLPDTQAQFYLLDKENLENRDVINTIVSVTTADMPAGSDVIVSLYNRATGAKLKDITTAIPATTAGNNVIVAIEDDDIATADYFTVEYKFQQGASAYNVTVDLTAKKKSLDDGGTGTGDVTASGVLTLDEIITGDGLKVIKASGVTIADVTTAKLNKSADYTVIETEQIIVIQVTTSAVPVTIKLPDPVPGDNRIFLINKESTSSNAEVIVTTISGTAEIIGDTTPQIFLGNTGFGVIMNETKYSKIQDSRPRGLTTSVTFYALTEASGIGGYNRAATSTTDPDYSQTPSDINSGAFTGLGNLLGGFISNAGVIIGTLTDADLGAIANFRTVGSGNAFAYVEIYKYEQDTTETLLTTSSKTNLVDSNTYSEFTVSAVVSSVTFISTDRFLIKLYGDVDGGGTAEIDMQVEGSNPGRVIVAIPQAALTHDSLSGLKLTGSGIVYGHLSDAGGNIAGVHTFSSFPVTPSSAPTTNYQVTNKKYVDDNVGGTHQVFHAQEIIAETFFGGTATSGAYDTRALSTVVTNQIPGATLISNQISLPIGEYELWEADSTGYVVDRHRSQLDAISGDSITLQGRMITSNFENNSSVVGPYAFTLTQTTVFELKQRVETSRGTDGRGLSIPSGWGPQAVANVYIVKIG